MIEPYETERQCNACRECKPQSAFSPGQAKCKSCRSATNSPRRTIYLKAREEIWPRPLCEALLDVGLKKWARGVADRERPLMGRLSA